MKIKRVITALIGFPFVVLLFAFGNKYIIDFIVAAIAVTAIHEYMNCVKNKEINAIAWISYLLAASICFLHVINPDYYTYVLLYGVPTLLLILFMHPIVTNMKITFEDVAYTFIGILYIVGFIVFIPLIYGSNHDISGKVLIWILMFAAWGTDTFAYCVGMKFGKHKFSKVSPNKSIEGCIGGLVGAVVGAVIYSACINYFMGLSIPLVTVGLITAVLSLIGQVGDFSASVIKRYFEIKDFSNLFPGHGGMIDRIDSVIFIAPFAYLLFSMFLGG